MGPRPYRMGPKKRQILRWHHTIFFHAFQSSCSHWLMSCYNESMKIKHGDKGFLYTTTSGYALSVQYGGGNYCGNREISFDVKGEAVPETSDCEIAMWAEIDGKCGPFLPLSDTSNIHPDDICSADTVRGWIPLGLIPHLMIALQDHGPQGVRDMLAESK